MLKNILAALIASFFIDISASAEIYTWKDTDGNSIYTDQQPTANAKPSNPRNTVNYYAAPTATAPTQSTTASEQLATLTADTDDDNEPLLTEEECQQNYRLNCDRVTHWLKYALEDCVNDQRCDDPDFLERKYRPRSMEEMQKIANRAAIRNNLQDKKIAFFLRKKYTNYCDNQAAVYCNNKSSSQCEATMLSYCKDPRGLKEIFAKYDNLTLQEKQQIIAKAKTLAIDNGGNQPDYEKVVASLIDILISQALMGL